MKMLIKAAALAAFTLGSAAIVPTAAMAQQAGTPQAAILVVDMDRVGAESAAGKSGAQQLQGKLQSLQSRAKQLNDSLNTEADALRKQQQANSIAPDALQARARELGQKQDGYRQEIAGREQDFQRSQAFVRQQIFNAVGPIIQQVMRERGAQLVISRDATLAMNAALDVTAEVIRRLDSALPRVSVTPPAQQQQQPATRPATKK